MSNLSPVVMNAIQKAISKEFKKVTVPENTITEFRGDVHLSLDITVKRGADVPNTPTVKLPYEKIIAVLIKRAKVDLDDVEDYILQAGLEADKLGEKLTRFEDEVQYSFEGLKTSIQEKMTKTNKAGPTSVKGIVRISSIEKKE